MSHLHGITLATVSLAALMAGSAQAQTADPTSAPLAPAAEATTAGTGIEDIVVTARRRDKSLQTIPVAISAITPQQIQQRDITSIEKIAATTPQFTVGRASSGSGAQLSMRGIGSNSTSIGIEQSVATVVDGAYSGFGRIIYEGFFDLDRIEILRGPQALFFGKNATAGVVSINTANPGDKLEVIGRTGYEFKSETIYAEGVISTPLTDTLGVRVALRGSKMFGGYYRNESPVIPYATTDVATGATTNYTAPVAAREQPGEKEFLGRITLQWKPTGQLTATLKANIDRNRVNNNSWNYVNFACANGFSTLSPTVPCRDDNFVVHQNDLPAEIASQTPFAGDGDLYNRYRSWNLIGNIDYDFGDVKLTSTTFYNENTNSWNCNCAYQTGPIWATERSTWRGFSNETRVTTDFEGPLNLLAGVFYQNTKRVFDQNVLFAGAENSAAPAGMRFVAYSKNSETKGETISGFGQVNWKFLPRFELAAGVRYIRETKDSYFIQPYVNPGLTALFVQGVAVNADQTFTNWSPEVTLAYKPTEDVNLYAAYKTAYKSGGLSNSGIYSALSTDPAADFIFEPEKAKGVEAGIKTTLLDRQLRFNTTLYRFKYTNLQVDFFNSPTFAFLTINAGSVITKGIETEFEYAPRAVPGLVFNASVNYNKARFRSFTGPCYSGQSTQLGCPSPTGPGGFPQQDLSGRPPAVAPEWTGTLGISYDGSLSEAIDFGFNANARYSDNYLASSLGNPLSAVGSYVTLDAGFQLRTPDRRYELALIGKNLTNRQYFLGAQDAPATGSGTGTPAGISADQSGYGTLPRTVQLQLTVRY
ncbi:TonB-dependent receptor [Sphingomonas sp. 1P06PA]|uniref:TonB-dependent receptor n=1 Tax=Sphingomonas sp. 1P06PA TaxID=554121 RepID=UPI0039A51049